MRKLLLLPLMLCATPALAQTPGGDVGQVQQRLTDPATAEKLARMMQALSDSFLSLPVGEVKAAAEGRPATAAEKKMTVRDLGQRDDPQFERRLQQQVANARPMIENSMKALATALPAMMQSLQQAEQALERAAANMPDPTYPKR